MADGPAVDHGEGASSQGRLSKAAEKVGNAAGRLRGGGKAQEQTDYKASAFKRNYFVNDLRDHQNGTSNPHRELWRRNEKLAVPHEKVQFSDESHRALSGFLEKHIQKIHDMHRDNPTDLPEEDVELLKLFVGADLSAELKLDTLSTKIDTKLKEDPRVWVMGIERYRDVQMLKRLALGAQTFTKLADEYHVYGMSRSTDLTRDQVDREGFVHKFGREKIMPHWDDIWDIGIKPGAVIAGNALALATGHPAIAALLTGGAFAYSATDSGQKTRDVLKYYADAFKVIEKDPKLSSYVKQITGGQIDPSDYIIDAAGELRLDPDKPLKTSRNVGLLIKEVKDGQEALNRINRELEIDDFHASPEEFIFRLAQDKGDFVEPAPTRYAKRIQDFMDSDPKLKITDRADVSGNIKKYMEARRKAMIELIQDYAESITGDEVDTKRSEVTAKIEARNKEGRIRKKKEEAHREAIKHLGEDKTRVTADGAVLTTYETSSKALQDKQKEIEEELTRGVVDASGDPYPSIEDAIRALTLLKTHKGAAEVIIDGQPMEPSRDLHEQALTWQTNELGKLDTDPKWGPQSGEKPAQATSRIQAKTEHGAWVREEYKRRVAEINDVHTAVINAEIQKLQAFQAEVKTAKKGLSGPDSIKAVEMLDKMSKSHAELTGWNGIGGLTVDDAAITKSIGETLDLMNKIHAADPTKGWAKEKNSDPEYRQRAIDAMTEASARILEGGDSTVRSRRSKGYNTLHGSAPKQYGLDDKILRASDVAEIRELVNERILLNKSLPHVTDEQIKNAIDESRNKLRVRGEAVNQRLDAMDKEVEERNRDIAKIPETLKDEMDQLRTVSTVMERRRTGISDKVFGMTAPKELAKYTHTDAIPTTGGEYTAAEVKLAAPGGYYELLDLMFDYKKGFTYQKENADGVMEEAYETREEYFQRIQKLLPPNELAKMLTESLSEGTAATTDIKAALIYISDRISTRRDTYRDLRRAFRDTIDTLYKQTGSIE